MDLNIQWYPGHMTKTKRALAAKMGLIDVIIELLDARIPLSSRNPDIDALTKGKNRVLVLNKADLADENTTAQWEKYFKKLGFFALPVNAKMKKGGAGKLTAVLKEIMRPKAEKQKARGRLNIPIRAMVLGIPNVGKSTFINRLTGRAGAAVEDRPGVTRGLSWLKVGEFDLMDTPGVLWPKFDDPLVGLKLACTGAVSDNVLDKISLAGHLIGLLNGIDPKILENRYRLAPGATPATCTESPVDDPKPDMGSKPGDFSLLEAIGQARGFKMKGGIIDLERTAITLLDEFRGGKLGRISLESPINE